ncbi:hypothetical protein SCNRRL3882_5279 [Streptomyces chartreusis NRRL 3882]|uniref:Uncharacterized protein n=1 Tax=Streptomyces chartreusis NRRL 3882 TaxID=1079985 RepID=A0A2N9BER4_STRCX|nr:hypothetical protein SCNRRL3882_5279 [Streptomyces chartreusis NRRL 3882]
MANLRARLYGELYEVEAVAIRPMCSVAVASAVSSVIGSSAPAGRWATLPHSCGPSARNSESKVPCSAIRASRT